MFKFLLPLALAVVLPLTSCQSGEEQASAEPTPTATATSTPTAQGALGVKDGVLVADDGFYLQALDKGKAAAELGAKAKTWQEFAIAGATWVQASYAMDAVPATSPNYAQAQEKSNAYEKASQAAYSRAKALEPKKPAEEAPAAPAAASELERLKAAIAEKDPSGAVVTGIEIDGKIAFFTVSSAYLAVNDDIKLETAKGLQSIWASVHGTESAYMYVKSQQGTTIASGGSNVKLKN